MINIKLIDFQVIRYAPPVLDMLFYLFCNTEKPFRDQYYEELKDIYYQSLCKQIRLFGSQPDTLYPRTVFESQLKHYAIFGMAISHLAIPFFIAKSGDVEDLDEYATKVESSRNCKNTVVKNKEELGEGEKGEEEINGEGEKVGEFIVEKHNILTATTLPIFERRILGLAKDMDKYGYWSDGWIRK